MESFNMMDSLQYTEAPNHQIPWHLNTYTPSQTNFLMEDTQLFFDNINNSPYLQHDTHSTNSILADDFVLPLAKTPDWRSSSVSSTVSDHSGSDSGYKPSKSKEEVPLKIQRRREQNRASQSKFRQRQAKNIKELNDQLESQKKEFEKLKRLVRKLQKRAPEIFESLPDFDETDASSLDE